MPPGLPPSETDLDFVAAKPLRTCTNIAVLEQFAGAAARCGLQHMLDNVALRVPRSKASKTHQARKLFHPLLGSLDDDACA